jgi:hypothetical protein
MKGRPVMTAPVDCLFLAAKYRVYLAPVCRGVRAAKEFLQQSLSTEFRYIGFRQVIR